MRRRFRAEVDLNTDELPYSFPSALVVCFLKQNSEVRLGAAAAQLRLVSPSWQSVVNDFCWHGVLRCSFLGCGVDSDSTEGPRRHKTLPGQNPRFTHDPLSRSSRPISLDHLVLDGSYLSPA